MLGSLQEIGGYGLTSVTSRWNLRVSSIIT